MKKFVISEEEKDSILNQHSSYKKILQENLYNKKRVILEYDDPNTITDADFWKKVETNNCVSGGQQDQNFYDKSKSGYVLYPAKTTRGAVTAGDYVVFYRDMTYDVYDVNTGKKKSGGNRWKCSGLEAAETSTQKSELDAFIDATKLADGNTSYVKWDGIADGTKPVWSQYYDKITFTHSDNTTSSLYRPKYLKGTVGKGFTSYDIKSLADYKTRGYVEMIAASQEGQYRQVDAPINSDRNHKMWEPKNKIGKVGDAVSSSTSTMKTLTSELDFNNCSNLIKDYYTNSLDPEGIGAAYASDPNFAQIKTNVQNCINLKKDKKGLFNMTGHDITKMVEKLTDPRKTPRDWYLRKPTN